MVDTASTGDKTASGKDLRELEIKDFEYANTQLPREAMIQRLRDALIVVDTNVLLGMYKQNEQSVETWFSVFTTIGDKLYIPGHTMFEFWRRRSSSAVSKMDEHVKRFAELRNSVRENAEQWAQTSGAKSLTTEQEASLQTIAEEIGRLEEGPKADINQRGRRFSSNPDEDEIVLKLRELAGAGVRFGEPYTPSKMLMLKNEADLRYSVGYPPGFEDAEKESNKYGDFLIWKETLQQCRVASDCRNVILVTNDTKSDWWLTLQGSKSAPFDWSTIRTGRGFSQHQTKIARPELYYEMLMEAGKRIYLLTSSAFLELAGPAFGVFIPSQVQSAVDESSYEFIEEGPFVLENSKGQIASAQVATNFKTTVLLPGSKIRDDEADSLSEGYSQIRAQLKQSGLLAEASHDGYRELTEPFELPSTSAAVGVVLGVRASGLDYWKSVRTGQTLQTLKRLANDPEGSE